jgi:hypothetical protein
MINSNIKISTLLYLILASIVVGSIIAYFTTKLAKDQRTEVLRSGIQNNFENSTETFSPKYQSDILNPETTTPTTPKEEQQVCAQVITPAKDPDTGLVSDFPTPCDVPENWIIIDTNY